MTSPRASRHSPPRWWIFCNRVNKPGPSWPTAPVSGGFPHLSRQWSKQVEIIHRGLGQGSDGSRYVGLPTHRLEDLSGKSPKQSLICWPHGVRREGAPNSSRGGAALPSYPGCLLPIESSTSRWESRVSEIHARICPAAVCGAVPSTLWSARHTVLPPR